MNTYINPNAIIPRPYLSKMERNNLCNQTFNKKSFFQVLEAKIQVIFK